MKKVMVGMSGGVDSSVAALLLKEQGYEVCGATLKLRPQDTGCGGSRDIEDAKLVCDKLGIRHYVFDFTDIFKSEVIDYFIGEYIKGRTPNPCSVCNSKIKFGRLLDLALEMGMDYIATGHYVKIKDGILKKAFSSKDQSYFLYHLTKYQLDHILFPLGDFKDKDQTREIARENSLICAKKPDSQEICFIPDKNYAGFLEQYCKIPPSKGDFIDSNGIKLGVHKGIWHYTIGQRKGLGISFGTPMYVVEIDAHKNTVTLGANGEQYSSNFCAGSVNWIIPPDSDEIRADIKIRHLAPPSPAIIKITGEKSVNVCFDSPQKSVTPGQSAVFYDGDTVLGGGIIL